MFVTDDDRSKAIVHKGQNALLEKVAAALDEQFPPEEYGNGWGTGHQSPGEVVRQFKIEVD